MIWPKLKGRTFLKLIVINKKSIKMKKRIFVGIEASLFATALFFNLSEANVNSNISLNDIETMAQASGEGSVSCNCNPRKPGMCYCYGFHPYEDRIW